MSPLSPPRKLRNQDVRPREYLTETEVESLFDAAAELGRHSYRDATMILILKHGVNAPHLLRGAEIRALRQVKREYPNTPRSICDSRWVSRPAHRCSR